MSGTRQPRRLSSTTPWFAVLRLSGQAGEAVGLLLVARTLGPASFGSVWAALLVARWGGIVGDWGASLYGAREVARQATTEVRTLARRRSALSCSLAVVYAVAAILFSPWATPIAITLLARGTNRDWIALGKGCGGRAGAPSVLQGMVVAGGLALVATRSSAAWVLAAAYGSAMLLSIALNRLPDRLLHCREERAARRPEMLYANAADQVSSSADALLLASIRGVTESGVYAAASRASTALNTVVGLLASGSVPGVVRRLDRGEDPSSLRRRMLRVSVPIGVLMAVAAPAGGLLSGAIFGSAYDGIVLPATLLIVATGIAVACLPYHIEAVAVGMDRLYARSLMIGAAVNVSMNVLVQPAWGATGAATAMVVSVSLVQWQLRRSLPPTSASIPENVLGTELRQRNATNVAAEP